MAGVICRDGLRVSLAKYFMQESVAYEPPSATILETVTLPAVAGQNLTHIAFNQSGDVVGGRVQSSGTFPAFLQKYSGFSSTTSGGAISLPGDPLNMNGFRFMSNGDVVVTYSGLNPGDPSAARRYAGLSNSQIGTFALATRGVGSMELIGDDIVWASQDDALIRTHDGFSSTVASSFTDAAGSYASAVSFDGTNLISVHAIGSNVVRIHDGISATILDTFTFGSFIYDMCFYDGNLYILDTSRNVTKQGRTVL